MLSNSVGSGGLDMFGYRAEAEAEVPVRLRSRQHQGGIDRLVEAGCESAVKATPEAPVDRSGDAIADFAGHRCSIGRAAATLDAAGVHRKGADG